MIEMLMENATNVRKEWSSVVDSVMHDKPKLIKRTRDRMWLSNLETMKEILDIYIFTAEKYTEPDGSVTLSLNRSGGKCTIGSGSQIMYGTGYYGICDGIL